MMQFVMFRVKRARAFFADTFLLITLFVYLFFCTLKLSGVIQTQKYNFSNGFAYTLTKGDQYKLP